MPGGYCLSQSASQQQLLQRDPYSTGTTIHQVHLEFRKITPERSSARFAPKLEFSNTRARVTVADQPARQPPRHQETTKFISTTKYGRIITSLLFLFIHPPALRLSLPSSLFQLQTFVRPLNCTLEGAEIDYHAYPYR